MLRKLGVTQYIMITAIHLVQAQMPEILGWRIHSWFWMQHPWDHRGVYWSNLGSNEELHQRNCALDDVSGFFWTVASCFSRKQSLGRLICRTDFYPCSSAPPTPHLSMLLKLSNGKGKCQYTCFQCDHRSCQDVAECSHKQQREFWLQIFLRSQFTKLFPWVDIAAKQWKSSLKWLTSLSLRVLSVCVKCVKCIYTYYPLRKREKEGRSGGDDNSTLVCSGLPLY